MKILIIGANGQIGTELAQSLALRHGQANIISCDLAPQGRSPELTHEMLDVTDAAALATVVKRHGIRQIYHLAAALSATGEQHPMWAWDLNMKGLLNVLELARVAKLERVFWPSSIAAFGPSTPALDTPQTCAMDPSTVYGISKLAGERWCAWYHAKHGVDVRSLRYPGLISYKTENGVTQKLTRFQMMRRVFRPRVLVYGAVLAAMSVAFAVSVSLRSPFQFDVIKDRGALSRVVGQGTVENVYRIQIMNRTERTQVYRVAASGPQALTLSAADVRIAPAAIQSVVATLRLPQAAALPWQGRSVPVEFEVRTIDAGRPGAAVQREKSTFQVPR
jgi:NAD(P)-dependent dehydrogenase (short-subunit alcohol dehydrogenase family)